MLHDFHEIAVSNKIQRSKLSSFISKPTNPTRDAPRPSLTPLSALPGEPRPRRLGAGLQHRPPPLPGRGVALQEDLQGAADAGPEAPRRAVRRRQPAVRRTGNGAPGEHHQQQRRLRQPAVREGRAAGKGRGRTNDVVVLIGREVCGRGRRLSSYVRGERSTSVVFGPEAFFRSCL